MPCIPRWGDAENDVCQKLCERIGNSLYVNWEGISECLDEKGLEAGCSIA